MTEEYAPHPMSVLATAERLLSSVSEPTRDDLVALIVPAQKVKDLEAALEAAKWGRDDGDDVDDVFDGWFQSIPGGVTLTPIGELVGELRAENVALKRALSEIRKVLDALACVRSRA